jgi:ribosomal protein L20A (L18A)
LNTTAANVLVIDELLETDSLACKISDFWMTWDAYRATKVADWNDIQKYIFAKDTVQSSNAKLPWSNKTTLPKLCQIRDNLHANYMATLFPKRKSIIWEGQNALDEYGGKQKLIEDYMSWTMDRNEFYDEISKCVLDYIDYGNCFVMPEWKDGRVLTETKEQVGYVGPTIRRISPLDIVFNPAASDFASAPKIIRSVISIGEVKDLLDNQVVDADTKEFAEKLWNYLKDLRTQVGSYPQNSVTRDEIYNIAGFDSYQTYLASHYCEILTFYGDVYEEDGKLLKNHVIQIVDRHKVLSSKPNPSFFGTAPIYHAGWRVRPDNLWAMGPLDNLTGLQYRIDHLENMKADVFDLIAYPPIKIKGYVEDFTWGPFERIYIGDADGDVEVMSPDVQALNAETMIDRHIAQMEEFAGAPKEAMGFRTPGEKTKYEVQRLENAASRIFQSKTSQFERQIVEPAINSMLELARRNLDTTTIRFFDEETDAVLFKSLTRNDITGSGRIKPIAARHFAEQAQQVQDLNGFFSSAVGQDPSILAHFSSVGLARLWEHLLDLEDYQIVQPYIRITEQSEAQNLAAIQDEQNAVNIQTPSGLQPGDYDQDIVNGAPGTPQVGV